MLTNLQHYLLQYHWLRICFDIAYLLFPVFLVYTCLKNKKAQSVLALSTAFFSILYNSFFSTMSFVSIENAVAWMFVPLLFYPRTIMGFYYFLQCERLLFIIIFFSAALWKIRVGGLFNVEGMSTILFRQHASYLAVQSGGMYTNLITYLINHQAVSYLLYFFAFVAEFIFVVGLFTKKFDKILMLSFCLFALADYILMGINYFTWLPFLGCLYFSKLTAAGKEQ